MGHGLGGSGLGSGQRNGLSRLGHDRLDGLLNGGHRLNGGRLLGLGFEESVQHAVVDHLSGHGLAEDRFGGGLVGLLLVGLLLIRRLCGRLVGRCSGLSFGGRGGELA